MINVGDKVICIDARVPNKAIPSIKKGAIYIVSGVVSCCNRSYLDIGICLRNPLPAECAICDKPDGSNPMVAYYVSELFRKIEEQKEYRVVEVATVITEERKDLVLN